MCSVKLSKETNMSFDFKSVDFRSLIKQKEGEILKRTTSGIFENDNFKRLNAGLNTFQKNFPYVDYLSILIPKEEIENLNSNISNIIEIQLQTVYGNSHNHVVVDRHFEIKVSERKRFKDGNELRRIYTELSKEICIFQISSQGIHGFVDGDDFGDAIFFTLDDQKSFNKLKSIDQIDEIFKDYIIYLRKRDTYKKFFVTQTGKKALYNLLGGLGQLGITEDTFLEQHKQLLNNKPEDDFREALRFFLKNNLKNILLQKEFVLDNFRRLDIFITDDYGLLYLIEVKWVGTSIHPCGGKIGTKYEYGDINPDAIIQSVDYIRELQESGESIKIAFLAVFDARDKIDNSDTYDGFDKSMLGDGLEKYFYKFKKIPDIKVMNKHPR